MGNLLASLAGSTGALRAFERQLTVIQNNVGNANTPGYVRQIQTLEALAFDPANGQPGGTSLAPLASARSDYLEQNVRRQQELFSFSDQKAGDLGQLESTFELNSAFSVPSALTKFFKSFSQLSINPNDSEARLAVIDQAGAIADSFHRAAAGLEAAAANSDRQIRDSVSKINDLVGTIRDLNQQRRQNASTKVDAGLDAKVHTTLEELSGYTNVNALQQEDGTYTLFLGGQVPALIGVNQHLIQADFSSQPTALRDDKGQDVTSILTGGRIGALLSFKNQSLPSYGADLDQLATSFADQINGTLAGGVDRNGNPPATSLFAYDPIAGAAHTIAVNAITPDDIAAALPSAPGGNGNALLLAQLGSQPVLNGFTFTQLYGNLGARAGRDLASAKDSTATQQGVVTQARTLRSDASSVSLDEEAAQLIQVQRAYQAAGKLIGVLQELTQTMIDIIR